MLLLSCTNSNCPSMITHPGRRGPPRSGNCRKTLGRLPGLQTAQASISFLRATTSAPREKILPAARTIRQSVSAPSLSVRDTENSFTSKPSEDRFLFVDNILERGGGLLG